MIVATMPYSTKQLYTIYIIAVYNNKCTSIHQININEVQKLALNLN